MSHLDIPATIEAAPTNSQPLLEAVKLQLGVAPNLFRLVANSPAALEGYLGLLGALKKGSLPASTHERIALAVAEINRCDYCLSAHTYLGRKVAQLEDAEMVENRSGRSTNAVADAAVQFATKLVRERGDIGKTDIQALRSAGYDDAQIVEIVLHVALNIWTNYVNKVAGTEIDFPVVTAGKAAA